MTIKSSSLITEELINKQKHKLQGMRRVVENTELSFSLRRIANPQTCRAKIKTEYDSKVTK